MKRLRCPWLRDNSPITLSPFPSEADVVQLVSYSPRALPFAHLVSLWPHRKSSLFKGLKLEILCCTTFCQISYRYSGAWKPDSASTCKMNNVTVTVHQIIIDGRGGVPIGSRGFTGAVRSSGTRRSKLRTKNSDTQLVGAKSVLKRSR